MFFDLFRRKKNKDIENVVLSKADKKWNRLWDLWAEGEIESPYNELMTYQSEVNNGGHHQYFLNTENNGDVRKDIKALCAILPDVLKDNIQTAFKSYVELEQDKNIDTNEEILEKCDDVFWENEEMINSILESYCKKIEI
ncbi:MAG: DUF4375 domain-containing protein [Clostridia bacterium]|nr:DUF4375 domain-containing protein [Clostridia bacterium]